MGCLLIVKNICVPELTSRIPKTLLKGIMKKGLDLDDYITETNRSL